jgi:acetyl-CoA acyltransferase
MANTNKATRTSEAVIVASVRTAVGKAPKGTLRQTRPDDMAGAAIRAALARVPALKPEMVEDVVLGCAMPEAEQGPSWRGSPRPPRP